MTSHHHPYRRIEVMLTFSKGTTKLKRRFSLSFQMKALLISAVFFFNPFSKWNVEVKLQQGH